MGLALFFSLNGLVLHLQLSLIHISLCTGCGKCVADCIAKNLRIQEKKAVVQKECFLCGHCVSICPYHAVSIPEYDMADVESCSCLLYTSMDRRLGRPLPHQLANPTRVHLIPPEFFTLYHAVPVSYTHLDVYKRQHHT